MTYSYRYIPKVETAADALPDNITVPDSDVCTELDRITFRSAVLPDFRSIVRKEQKQEHANQRAVWRAEARLQRHR